MKLANTGVEVRRILDASPERVFAAFADSAMVAQWLRPSAEVRLTVLQFDFRPGGKYRFLYESSGVEPLRVGGAFLVIEAPARLVFSWLIEPPDVHAGIDSRVSVTLVPHASSTELILRHDRFERTDAEQRHDQGWRGALSLLQAQLQREVNNGD